MQELAQSLVTFLTRQGWDSRCDVVFQAMISGEVQVVWETCLYTMTFLPVSSQNNNAEVSKKMSGQFLCELVCLRTSCWDWHPSGECGGVKTGNRMNLRLREIFLHALAESLTKGLVVER